MRRIHLSLVLALALLLGALAPGAAAQDEPLRMGLLPILDVLPFYVAQEAGYFEEEGVELELIPVSSALERDQMLLVGEIDGMLNDLISTGIFNQDETRVVIVALARKAYDEAPQFRILAAPRSNITIPSDLVGKEIAISENSVIHYIAQRMLEQAGISASEVTWRPEPNIPVRYQLLMEGQLPVVVLPDPLAQAAIEGGAILIEDDSALVDTGFSQSVLSFRREIVEEQPEKVEAFLRAWMRAAEDINADPEAYRELWIEHTNVPDSVKDSYQLPPFPTYEITQPEAWEDTVDWLIEQEIIENRPAYEDTVDPSFIEAIAPEDMGEAEGEAGVAGDPEAGATVFTSLGCGGCHATEGDVTMVGPSLDGLAARAGQMVEGLSAAAYVEQSIVEPDAHVVEGFNAGIMPPYASLSETDLANLVAYLLTLD
ncbi:MAG TPA: ABC transporter substrate-binding protein [Aggregatilineaceae bacterium]|jgi:NitT/TauT family transport system substrate-binding protein|nr:ABC transporter substrate-binding protein [Aggregatilineaceae bacterium]